MKSRVLVSVTACAISLIAMSADAELISRLCGQLVYDTDRDITYLANANLAASETFGIPRIPLTGDPLDSSGGIQPDGAMKPNIAEDWITAMNNSDGGNGYLGFNGWRLPFVPTQDPTCDVQEYNTSMGLNCTGGDLGHLFYEEFDGTSRSRIVDTGNQIELAKFTNIRGFKRFEGWTSFYLMEPVRDGSAEGPLPLNFTFEGGGIGNDTLSVDKYVWPVHDGDIGATVELDVCEPCDPCDSWFPRNSGHPWDPWDPWGPWVPWDPSGPYDPWGSWDPRNPWAMRDPWNARHPFVQPSPWRPSGTTSTRSRQLQKE